MLTWCRPIRLLEGLYPARFRGLSATTPDLAIQSANQVLEQRNQRSSRTPGPHRLHLLSPASQVGVSPGQWGPSCPPASLRSSVLLPDSSPWLSRRQALSSWERAPLCPGLPNGLEGAVRLAVNPLQLKRFLPLSFHAPHLSVRGRAVWFVSNSIPPRRLSIFIFLSFVKLIKRVV